MSLALPSLLALLGFSITISCTGFKCFVCDNDKEISYNINM